jgi:uncharacterized protein (DUF1697 family)
MQRDHLVAATLPALERQFETGRRLSSRKLGARGTARNWNTVLKLLALGQG